MAEPSAALNNVFDFAFINYFVGFGFCLDREFAGCPREQPAQFTNETEELIHVFHLQSLVLSASGGLSLRFFREQEADLKAQAPLRGPARAFGVIARTQLQREGLGTHFQQLLNGGIERHRPLLARPVIR